MAELSSAIDLICFVAALASIAAYVAALLRNRPYLRPMNSLGLLLVGGALLCLPSVIVHPIPADRVFFVICPVVLLVASAVFQGLSAFRRRKARAGDAPQGAPSKATGA